MKVGRTSDESWTDVGRKTDESWTNIGRTSDVERVKLSRRCGDGGRQHYTAAPRNATTMAGSVAAHSVVAALADNALQLATFFRHCCSNALDFTACYYDTTKKWCIIEFSSLLGFSPCGHLCFCFGTQIANSHQL